MPTNHGVPTALYNAPVRQGNMQTGAMVYAAHAQQRIQLPPNNMFAPETLMPPTQTIGADLSRVMSQPIAGATGSTGTGNRPHFGWAQSSNNASSSAPRPRFSDPKPQPAKATEESTNPCEPQLKRRRFGQ